MSQSTLHHLICQTWCGSIMDVPNSTHTDIYTIAAFHLLKNSPQQAREFKI